MTAIRQAIELGVEHHQAGRLAEAERIYRRILATDPRNAEALYLLGVLAHQVGMDDSAVQLIEQAIRLDSSNPHFHNDLGEAYSALRRPSDALRSFERSLTLRPDFLAALNNRGNVLLELKRFDQSIASYEKALAIDPNFAKAANNRGVALEELRRHDEALASYDRALAIKPDYAEALDNRGLALYELKRYHEAIASYDRALTIKPQLAQALWHRGNALIELKRHDEALESYRGALSIDREYAEAHASAVHLRQQLCDWQGLEPEFEVLRRRSTQPFILFAIPGVPAGDQLSCARRFADAACGASLSSAPLHAGRHYEGGKLRVGYLSADFRDHPVSQLLVETIELHDRERFDVFAYSYGADDHSPLRRRLESAFDTFRDVATMPDSAVARRIVDDGIQILIDLTGHTRNARLPIIALRPAPIQVTWFGYPGTLGHARLADYIIGDAIVTPPESRGDFSETLALMPHCFQPNDRKRAIGDRPTRQVLGLPAEGFVFCCFNQSYKINAPMFDIWCRLLAAVQGSVLWLLGETPTMQRNLRSEAQARGISPDRLVFAPRVAPAEHLARMQVADLFLDTLPCNAGATASDALWAGVPLVTSTGETLVGRYAASLLYAAGLPELVTSSLTNYETLSLRLATDAASLKEIRAKLAANRASCALFDSKQFACDLEGLFQKMWADHVKA
ncbi:MAG: tetratricopeptide repeat protein [Betaproteobacteria bacterium]|nr:tetratricopeptide repeat protein [Betaproteobacteria bacterium]